MTFFIILLFAYLIGSIPWGYIVAKMNGINIHKVGSGNTGMTNVTRALGLQYGLIVGFLDVVKGLFIALLAKFTLNDHWQIAAVLLAVVLGHIFSVFLRGKGGKGVATTVGILILLIYWKVILIALVAWLAILAITRLMSLTNLIISLLLPLYFLFIESDTSYLVLSMILTSLIFWTHRNNIERLKQGTELRLDIQIGFKRRKKAKIQSPKKGRGRPRKIK